MAGRINTLPPELLSEYQIIHSRVRDLDPTKKKIYVLHDLPGDPEVQHLKNGGWQKFDKLVFVSHWQQQMYHSYLGIPYSAGIVLQNAIYPIKAHTKPKDKIRLIYFSTPHRGLELLLPVYNKLYQEYGDLLELKIFSSFDLYGWDQRDTTYQELFDYAKTHPGIVYKKSVPNEVIRQELKLAHILAYPSIWQETSCLVLIESMSAGLSCVHSSLGALPETAMGMTYMYGYTEERNDHANRFFMALKEAIEDVKMGFELAPDVLAFVQNTYSWENRQHQWISLLTELLTSS